MAIQLVLAVVAIDHLSPHDVTDRRGEVVGEFVAGLRHGAGDLSSNVRLCKSCISALAPGSSRWTLYHCRECMPAVARLNRLAGGCVVPIGPHSIMNGVFAAADPAPNGAQLTSFAAQLGALFRHQENLAERTKRRVRERVGDFGITSEAIAVDDYLVRCAESGWTAERGFADLVQSLDDSLDEAAASELWSSAENVAP